MMVAAKRRKLVLFLALIATPASVAAIGFAYWRHESRAPQMWLATSEVQLPVCRARELHHFSVLIENRGSSDLRLKIIGVTCACSRVGLERTVLPPGESTALTGVIRAGSSPGGYSSEVGIATNDPDMPFAEIRIAGNVQPYIEISPTTVALRPNVRSQTPGRAPLRIRNDDDSPLQVSVETPGMPVTSSRTGKILLDPGDTTVVDFTCAADVIQHRHGQIVVRSTHDVQSVTYIELVIIPALGLEIHPAAIRFGMIQHTETPDKQFTLQLRGSLADGATVTRVTVPPFLCLARTGRNPATQMIEVGFTFSPICRKGVLEGTIGLDIAFENQPIGSAQIMISVDGIVR